jgi:hypothetical protein
MELGDSRAPGERRQPQTKKPEARQRLTSTRRIEKNLIKCSATTASTLHPAGSIAPVLNRAASAIGRLPIADASADQTFFLGRPSALPRTKLFRRLDVMETTSRGSRVSRRFPAATGKAIWRIPGQTRQPQTTERHHSWRRP